ncbi:hypothetical protein Dsin_007851 [Dipteronia sinensis]|uniref:Cysteine alpha-hairpin motif superfamily n=1 Tax=Dipteronia sinensis TaxID=43782 RepID=A0AAE0B2K2_9ROSI|nr:hypothetical protein Dsin_007851 [Dipteronia sinensis]
MEKIRDKPECAVEALDLLNCVAQSPFDQDKCLRLVQVLRDCVVNKKVKKFSLADEQGKEANQSSKKA